MTIDRERIRNAWMGRISGCQLGKPIEVMSMLQGHAAVCDYLERAEALPLRDYVPALEGSMPANLSPGSCKGRITRSEPDDDINYSVLALQMLEEKGLALTTAHVARAWLRLLPAGMTFTAERAAYLVLLTNAHEHFHFGAEPGFDLALCSDNPYNDWIGAQIRADVYGWVTPGRPALAADLARRDAALSHRGEGVHGAAFVAAVGAAIPATPDLAAAVAAGLAEVPAESGAAAAIGLGRSLVGADDAVARLHAAYPHLSPVHTLNNLALVVWGLLSGESDFGVAIGETVAAGWDTDCNGATVGGLWGLTGREIPRAWTEPWAGCVAVTLAGMDELPLDSLVDRTVAVAERIAAEADRSERAPEG